MTEFNESDEWPKWLSLADLNYHGGGIMHRRPSNRAVGRRGGTSARVAENRHEAMNEPWFERVERDKT